MPKIEDMTQEDVDKMQNRLDESKTEAKKFREQRDEARAALDSNEVNSTLKERALKAEAKLKVATLGIKDPDRVVKYLDFTSVDFAEDGTLTGLDESIETVKGDFPELFDPKRRVAGKADAAADTEVKVEKDPHAQAIDKVFGIR